MFRWNRDSVSTGAKGRFLRDLPTGDDTKTAAGLVLLLGLLLVLACTSAVGVVLALGAAVLILAVLSAGLEGTATGMILLAMFFAPLNDVRPSDAVSFVTAADLLFVLGLGLLAPVAAFRKFNPPVFFVVGSVILVSIGVLASLVSEDPGLSLNHMTRLVVSALVLPIAFMFWRPRQAVVLKLAAAYLAGQVVSVGYALIEGSDPVTGRYTGLTTHFNFFGLSALLAATLVPYIAASVQRPMFRWAVWAAGLVCVYGIWISGSRAALLVVVLMSVAYPVFGRSVKAAGLLYLAGTVILVLAGRLIDDEGNNALSRLLGGGQSDYADIEREAAFKVATKAFWQHPVLGNGFVDALEAHNIYLQIAVAVGVVGAVGYVFLLWATVSPIINLPQPFNLLGYPALAYATVGLITNSLWDRFIWAVLALSLIAHLLPDDDVPPKERGAQDSYHPDLYSRESVKDRI